MTPDQKIIAKIVFLLLFCLGLFLAGFGVRGYIARADQTKALLAQQSEHNKALAAHNTKLTEATNRNLRLQNQINQLNSAHTEALYNALEKNDRLRSDLAVAQRMRLQGTSCPAARTGADHPSSGSLGDDREVELSTATRQAVWDLRESIIRDQAVIEYLRDWARRVLATNPEIEKPAE